ncbi:MAG: hypothetical protein U0790_15720 [Isosphaeraceae bacterium]
MTSAARIEANRRNAQRSSGPRTEAGKQAVRFNALKDGLDVQTAVLPHEDADAFERRRSAWTRDLSPGGEGGDYLAGRAVTLSWQLDRADAAEQSAPAVAAEQSQDRDPNALSGEELRPGPRARSRCRPAPRPALRTAAVGPSWRRPGRHPRAGEPAGRPMALAS